MYISLELHIYIYIYTYTVYPSAAYRSTQISGQGPQQRRAHDANAEQFGTERSDWDRKFGI